MTRCRIGYSSLIINECGEIRICREMKPIGNIREMRPSEAWQSKRAEQIRKQIAECDKDCKVLNCNYIERE